MSMARLSETCTASDPTIIRFRGRFGFESCQAFNLLNAIDRLVGDLVPEHGAVVAGCQLRSVDRLAVRSHQADIRGRPGVRAGRARVLSIAGGDSPLAHVSDMLIAGLPYDRTELLTPLTFAPE